MTGRPAYVITEWISPQLRERRPDLAQAVTEATAEAAPEAEAEPEAEI